MKKYTISPCFNCGADTSEEVMVETYGPGGRSYVDCIRCGVQGPAYDEVDATWTGDEKQAAVDGWNRLWILVHKAPQGLDWIRARKNIKEEVRALELTREHVARNQV